MEFTPHELALLRINSVKPLDCCLYKSALIPPLQFSLLLHSSSNLPWISFVSLTIIAEHQNSIHFPDKRLTVRPLNPPLQALAAKINRRNRSDHTNSPYLTSSLLIFPKIYCKKNPKCRNSLRHQISPPRKPPNGSPRLQCLRWRNWPQHREPSRLHCTNHPLPARTVILLLATVYLPLHLKLMATVSKIHYFRIISLRCISVLVFDSYLFLKFPVH